MFKWTIDCEDAFQSLKHALNHPSIVAHPILTQPFLLYMVASQDSIVSVLAQHQDSKKCVTAYASHTLRPPLPLTVSCGQLFGLLDILSISCLEAHNINNKFYL